MSARPAAHSVLAPGAPAPDFALHSTPDQLVSLADFRGQPVILAFYPADWSPVCGDQMALYNEILPEIHPVRRRTRGTPTFFINGRRHDGRYQLEELMAAIADASQ